MRRGSTRSAHLVRLEGVLYSTEESSIGCAMDVSEHKHRRTVTSSSPSPPAPVDGIWVVSAVKRRSRNCCCETVGGNALGADTASRIKGAGDMPDFSPNRR